MTPRTRLARRVSDKSAAPTMAEPTRAGFRAEPPPPTDQTAQRAVRQAGGSAPPCGARHAGTDAPFDFGREIAELVAGLERSTASLPRPGAMRGALAGVVNAVNATVLVVAELLAESRGVPVDIATLAARTSAELGRLAQDQRSHEVPVVTDEQVTAGTWSAPLIARAERLSAPLVDLLDRAYPPAHPRLNGEMSASEQVERALRRIDLAVRDASSHLARVTRHQALPTPEQYNASRRADEQARRERDAAYRAQLRAQQQAGRRAMIAAAGSY